MKPESHSESGVLTRVPNEMVERVSRAIAETTLRIQQEGIDDSIKGFDAWRACLDRHCALAAIAAMREPTEAMIDAAAAAEWDMCAKWRAMIDEALRD